MTKRTTAPELVMLPLECITPNPHQPRRHFDEAELQELARSLKAHGLLQPIVVRPVTGKRHAGVTHALVAGERRWRAAQLAGWHEIACTVGDLSSHEAEIAALAENVQRADLTDAEECRALQRIAKALEAQGKPSGYLSVAKIIGKSATYAKKRLAAQRLRPDVASMLERNSNVLTSAYEINRISDDTDRRQLIQAVDEGAPYQQVKQWVERLLADAAHLKDSQTPPDAETRQAIAKPAQQAAEARREVEDGLQRAHAGLTHAVAWSARLRAADRRELAPMLEKVRDRIAEL